MNKMGRQAIRAMLDGRSFFLTSLKSVRERRYQLHARDVRGSDAICLCPLEEKIVSKSYFPCTVCIHFKSRKHAELLQIYFKPLVNHLKCFAVVP